MIEGFASHPAFHFVGANVKLVESASIDYEYVIQSLSNELVEANPGGEPEWVRYIKDSYTYEKPTVPLHVFAGLLCLFDALSNLNQLVYQGLFGPEPSEISREQVIDYVWTTRGAGPGMWIMHLSQVLMIFVDPGDIIRLKVDRPGHDGLNNRLCSVHSKTFSGSTAPGILTMSMIDKHLNAYGYLLPRNKLKTSMPRINSRKG